MAIVGDLDDDGLLRPSRCEGWTVADVLLHLAQTNEMAVASAQGRLREYFEATAAGVAVRRIDRRHGRRPGRRREGRPDRVP